MVSSIKSLRNIDVRGSRILIVDYDRLNIRVLGGILQREGHVLASADKGETALSVYREFQPDLVLIDAQIPGMNGFDTCRALKAEFGDACASVVFLTAKADSQDVIAGLAAGAVDYLRKPFSSTEVVARIHAQLRYRVLMARQTALVEELGQANAEKNKFLGLAANDLRNPLASIYQLAKFLQDGTTGPLPADQLDLVQTIFSTSQSMLGMVNELLDVVTIESGELKLLVEPTNLASLLERCVYVINIDAAKKRSRIVFTPPAEVVVAHVDPAKMKQVIDNLLTNAVKYSPPGSIVRVHLLPPTDANGPALGVIDQGPGIPESERDKLFRDFGRLSVKPTGGEKSTGLGLAICRKIVDAHGATIVAENQPAGGCEFRVTLAKAA